MTGNNHLSLNQATMVEVVQQWIDREFVKDHAPQVAAVNHDHQTGTFTVKLVDREQEKTP